VAVPPATRVTPATALQRRPAEGFAESETAPAKPPREVTVTVEVPELVARILAGETGPVETLKSGVVKVPYNPLTSGTPVMLNPLESAMKSRPVLLVTVSGNATLVPEPVPTL
jgi:hypothetical protein